MVTLLWLAMLIPFVDETIQLFTEDVPDRSVMYGWICLACCLVPVWRLDLGISDQVEENGWKEL